MTIQQANEAYKLMFEKQRSIVNQYLDFVMQMEPESEIQVIPDYPNGWHALVAANGYIWTIKCNDGYFGLVDVATCHGIRPNGTLIPISEEDATRKAIACQSYFLEYTDDDQLPLTCDVFCDRDETPCRFCKVAREKLYDME